MRVAAVASLALLVTAPIARASGWRTARASSYSTVDSPGTMGCTGTPLRDDRLTFASRDEVVACGARVRFCLRRRCVTATRTDSGPWVAGRDFDLAAATTRALCGCTARAWGVRAVHWRLA